jgi:hypothetical protein
MVALLSGERLDLVYIPRLVTTGFRALVAATESMPPVGNVPLFRRETVQRPRVRNVRFSLRSPKVAGW